MSTGSAFYETGVWSGIMLIALILLSLIVANILKQNIKLLRNSLIPVSVLGGILLLITSSVVKSVTGEYIFNHPVFNYNSAKTGIEILEILTYHCLAVGFIAMTLRKSGKGVGRERITDIFNTGVLTVSTYVMQGGIGAIITAVASVFIPKLLKCSGFLLCFGYGQGTGQALNYGSIYEGYNWPGGKSFGLSIAAMGFLSAAIGGVIFLNLQKKRGLLNIRSEEVRREEKIEDENEIPMVESVDKMTIQIALIGIAYAICYAIMYLLGNLVGVGLKSTIYGFNFLFGALSAIIVKFSLKLLMKLGLVKRDYLNNFLLSRISGFAFDIMITAGIGAIQFDLISDYWFVLLLLGLAGAFSTYFYNRFVAFRLFPDYANEEFLVMYGTLTGTASTGMILLREADPNYETHASENLVYQNFPAIVFGFPLMLLASFAPKAEVNTYIVIGIAILAFAALNVILFRKQIFKKKK